MAVISISVAVKNELRQYKTFLIVTYRAKPPLRVIYPQQEYFAYSDRQLDAKV